MVSGGRASASKGGPPLLLVQGGVLDPHIQCLLQTVVRRAIPHLAVLTAPDHAPSFAWDFKSGDLRIDGQKVRPAAAFVRYNVFSRPGMAPENTSAADSFRAQAWYAAMQGWISASPGVRVFNRRFGLSTTNKPGHLLLAQSFGLEIPQTQITNHVGKAVSGKIAKPVAGGGYAFRLADALADFEPGTSLLPSPAIVQEELVPPEVRVFLVGRKAFAFEVRSPALDYRTTATEVVPVPVPKGLIAPLRRLARHIGLEFAAADFKTHPKTGRLIFLEINSGPMFARFDHETKGRLSEAMTEWLVDREGL